MAAVVVVSVAAGRAAVPRGWDSGMGCRRAVPTGSPPAAAAENDSAWMAATSDRGPSAATGVGGRGGKTVGRAIARAGSAASWGRSAPSRSQAADLFGIALRPKVFSFFLFLVERGGGQGGGGNESNAMGTRTIVIGVR